MFYISTDYTISYDELIHLINHTTSIRKKHYASDYRDFISNTIAALINNLELDLVDYSNTENKFEPSISYINNITLHNIDELIDKILHSTSNIGIYSSGTEGPPKLIYQNIQRLLKSTKKNNDYYNSRWAFTYNPSHSAGIQVFLQAIINKACLFDFYKCHRSFIIKSIDENQVNFLSGTPTFYRMLAPYDFTFHHVEGITFNGEKSTNELIQQINICFPGARIRNIYGSTESGPLMSSDSSIFILPARLLDKVKIVDKELFLHHSIMSKTVANQEWYATGDLVDIIDEEPLTINFVSRKSRIINVGGQNVNPQEIEECLLKHNDILEAQVIPRENKLIGNVITASIVTNNLSLTEKDIIDYLKQKIASYKIPRIIKFVEEISIGRTGKKRIN